MSRNRRRWLLVTLAITVLLVGIGLLNLRGGIRGTIRNAGSAPIRSVVAHVTGDLLRGRLQRDNLHLDQGWSNHGEPSTDYAVLKVPRAVGALFAHLPPSPAVPPLQLLATRARLPIHGHLKRLPARIPDSFPSPGLLVRLPYQPAPENCGPRGILPGGTLGKPPPIA